MSTIISPSLLSANFLNLEEDLKKLNHVNDLWIHLDIMDGHFVPNLTFGEPVLKNLKTITPHKLDAHLMVSNPDFFADQFATLGLHNFTFHWESVIHHDRLISKLKSIYPSVGISINPSSPLDLIPNYIFEKIDLILLMSVNPGFGGQQFLPSVFDKIKKLKDLKEKSHLNFQIQVDGGVSELNAQKLISAGANNLVAGSFIFSEPNKNYQERINKLR
jgi:ribulose-phosphate 3-epimerase